MNPASLIHPLSLNVFAYLGCVAGVLGILVTCGVVTVWRGFAFRDAFFAALIACAAAVVLEPSLNHAAGLRTSPDSVEYAVGALNIFSHGRYEIAIGGEAFAPRYPIGFSLFVVLPSLILAGPGSLGVGVYSVVLLGALGVAAAFLVGRRLYNRAAGLMAAAIVLVIPGYAGASQEVLTFVPAAGLSLLVFAFLLAGSKSGLVRWIAVGLTSMIAVACRPTSAVMLLPIIVAWWRDTEATRLREVLLGVFPTLIWIGASFFYNEEVFGNPFRTGYHLWCPIPYDYPQLLLNGGYLGDNFSVFFSSGSLILFAVAVVGLLQLKERESVTPVQLSTALAVLIAALIIVQFHLFYFYQWELYFLVSSALMAPLAACALNSLVRKALPRGRLLVAICLLAASGTTTWFRVRSEAARDTQQFEQLMTLKQTASLSGDEGGVVVITGRNPVLVESEAGILTIPVSRRVEYASKLLAPRKLDIGDPTAISPTDHRNARLRSAGAMEALTGTALTDPQLILRLLSRGVVVLIDTPSLSSDEREALDARFRIEPVGSGVERIATQR